MDKQVLFYFKWIMRATEREMLLFVWMYKADLLVAPCRLALEAVEALAND